MAVYGTFIFFNAIEGSAALGLVCFGVTLSLLKEGIGPDTCEGVLQLWQALAYCCNNIIFIFSGYVVGREIFSTEGVSRGSSSFTGGCFRTGSTR